MRSILDEVMPDYDVHEVHETWVPAAADVVFAAIKQVTAREVRSFATNTVVRDVCASYSKERERGEIAQELSGDRRMLRRYRRGSLLLLIPFGVPLLALAQRESPGPRGGR